MEVGEAGTPEGEVSGAGQAGEQETGEDGDDGNGDEELDQGETG